MGDRHEQDKATGEEGRGALALRALAHPLRWKLIDLLGTEESATATRCAEVLGESVPSCAYHLGILAKYGYIELVPGHTGREKPWRLASYEQDLSGEGLGTDGELAAEAATDAFLAAGWTKANLVDAIIVVGDKTITNYLHGVTKVAVDFPSAEKLAA